MAFNDGFLTEEQRQLLRSASQGRDSACSLISPKSSGSEQEHHVKYGAGSAKNHGGVPPGKYMKRSHSGKLGCPKKGGSGGKGTWGGLLDTAGDLQVDRKDPNYDSEECRELLHKNLMHGI